MSSRSALEQLNALVGEWATEGAHPLDSSLKIGGSTSFEWLEGGGFLVQRFTVEHPEFPNGAAIIGLNPDGEDFLQHYFDSRGVHRVYEMSISGGVWKLWRDGEPFPQRFTGTFGDDGDIIAGRWEKAGEDNSWETDFDLTYTKVRDA